VNKLTTTCLPTARSTLDDTLGTFAKSRRVQMKTFALKLKKFLKSEDGPTAVEYAVMLALIVVVCLTTIQSLGTNANATFSKVSSSLTTASS
jgi:pilus assembly protein Flp/PilA